MKYEYLLFLMSSRGGNKVVCTRSHITRNTPIETFADLLQIEKEINQSFHNKKITKTSLISYQLVRSYEDTAEATK